MVHFREYQSETQRDSPAVRGLLCASQFSLAAVMRGKPLTTMCLSLSIFTSRGADQPGPYGSCPALRYPEPDPRLYYLKGWRRAHSLSIRKKTIPGEGSFMNTQTPGLHGRAKAVVHRALGRTREDRVLRADCEPCVFL